MSWRAFGVSGFGLGMLFQALKFVGLSGLEDKGVSGSSGFRGTKGVSHEEPFIQ